MFDHVFAYVMAAMTEREDKGATAVEYALVIGLVSIVVVAAVALFGPQVVTFVNGVSFR
ncbi:MAG: pilus assembly protein Flp/PilA [Nocardioidaceae bacterium]|nr:pilus assembly protein Flp/PilA [Nocardioidaceae bacterium]